MKYHYKTHDGKSSGSESIGLACLRGVLAGDELGKAIGEELPPAVDRVR